MRILKTVFLSVLLVVAAVAVHAQAKIDFAKTEYDFGSIKEESGMAVTFFKFTNSGDAPLIISNVTASCGCTTPEWSKEPVAPGKSAEIKVGYNPKNRPGPFKKSISVYSNTQPALNVLIIKGDVAKRPPTIEEEYPRPMGKLRFKTNFLTMGDVVNTQTKTGELKFINTSSDTVKASVYRAPGHIIARFVPETILPGDTGKLIVDYNGAKINAYGNVNDRIYLTIDNQRESSLAATVAATIVEDFSKLTPDQLTNAPQAAFDKNVYDFGMIKEGQTISNTFKLTNTGKSDLLIRSVRTTCGCTTTKNANMVKAGETIDFTVTFNSQGKRGRQNRSVTVITNDPKNSSLVVRIIGTVDGK